MSRGLHNLIWRQQHPHAFLFLFFLFFLAWLGLAWLLRRA